MAVDGARNMEGNKLRRPNVPNSRKGGFPKTKPQGELYNATGVIYINLNNVPRLKHVKL